jgi:hypothetical protein
MVELKAMLHAAVIKGNRQIGMPVFCASRAEGQEHRLEQRTTLVPSRQLFRRNFKPTYLRT